MKIIEADNEFLVIDFESKSFKGKTTKANFKKQMNLLKECFQKSR